MIAVILRTLGLIWPALVIVSSGLFAAVAGVAKSALDGELSAGDQNAFRDTVMGAVRRAVPWLKVPQA